MNRRRLLFTAGLGLSRLGLFGRDVIGDALCEIYFRFLETDDEYFD